MTARRRLSSPPGLRAVAVLLLVLGLGAGALAAVAPSAHAAASSPVKATLTGPSLLAWGTTATYHLNATGGPAFDINGTKVGNVTYYASVTAANMTNVSFGPGSATLTNGGANLTLTDGNNSQTVTLTVMVSSVYKTQNSTTNVTYLVSVVQPYELLATLVVGPASGVASFQVQVDLDGVPVGTVVVPSLAPNATYHLQFDYAVASLAPGWHTFSMSLAQEHGLVVFAGGGTTFQSSFYVAGAPPDYLVWYLFGAVAFVGAIFIWLARVGARRSGRSKK